MGYEIVYQYGKFHIYSTIVMDYVATNLPDEEAVKEWFRKDIMDKYMKLYKEGKICFVKDEHGKYAVKWIPCSEVKPPYQVVSPEEYIEAISNIWYEEAKRAKERKKGGVEVVFSCQLDQKGNPVCVWRGSRYILPPAEEEK